MIYDSFKNIVIESSRNLTGNKLKHINEDIFDDISPLEILYVEIIS